MLIFVISLLLRTISGRTRASGFSAHAHTIITLHISMRKIYCLLNFEKFNSEQKKITYLFIAMMNTIEERGIKKYRLGLVLTA